MLRDLNCAQLVVLVFTFSSAGAVQTPWRNNTARILPVFLTIAPFRVWPARQHTKSSSCFRYFTTAFSIHHAPDSSLCGHAEIEWRMFYFCHAWQKRVSASCSIPRFSSSVRWGKSAEIFPQSDVRCFQGNREILFFCWGRGDLRMISVKCHRMAGAWMFSD
jgi:hypothetical protein